MELDPSLFAVLGKWGLPAYIALHIWREWLNHQHRMRALEVQAQLQEAVRQAHDALREDDVWQARDVLSKSLPPKGKA